MINTPLQRCGYCGQPTDVDGNPIEVDSKTMLMYDDPTTQVMLVHGECCVHQVMYEQERRTVTREMASDAGMPDIEGMQY